MDIVGQWLGVGLAVMAAVATAAYVRVIRLARRMEHQLRALQQRESWQRRT